MNSFEVVIIIIFGMLNNLFEISRSGLLVVKHIFENAVLANISILIV